MRVATFNIWNSSRGMPLREKQIVNELNSISSDIICLQEVKSEVYDMLKNNLSNYDYSYYHISEEHDGLAIFSKHPLLTKVHTNYAILVTCEYNNNKILVVNVHLPWDSVMKKENYMVKIIHETSKIAADYTVLTGDFNCSDKSSVHQYLIGDITLLNTEANPCYYDLAEVYAEINNETPENTLNIRTNPRWQGNNVAYTGGRVDRVYLKDAFPKSQPILKSFALFGKEINEKSGYCASDHYGVMVEVELE